jgi:hypothetical protein
VVSPGDVGIGVVDGAFVVVGGASGDLVVVVVGKS